MSEKSFENSLAELEKIVEKMEEGGGQETTANRSAVGSVGRRSGDRLERSWGRG